MNDKAHQKGQRACPHHILDERIRPCLNETGLPRTTSRNADIDLRCNYKPAVIDRLWRQCNSSGLYTLASVQAWLHGDGVVTRCTIRVDIRDTVTTSQLRLTLRTITTYTSVFRSDGRVAVTPALREMLAMVKCEMSTRAKSRQPYMYAAADENEKSSLSGVHGRLERLAS